MALVVWYWTVVMHFNANVAQSLYVCTFSLVDSTLQIFVTVITYMSLHLCVGITVAVHCGKGFVWTPFRHAKHRAIYNHVTWGAQYRWGTRAGVTGYM